MWYWQGPSLNYIQLAAGLGWPGGSKKPPHRSGIWVLTVSWYSIHFPLSPLSRCPLSSICGLLLQQASPDSLVAWQLGSKTENSKAARPVELSAQCLLPFMDIAGQKASQVAPNYFSIQ